MAYKNAYLDIRYDLPSNNAATINPQLAHLKAIGYNTVTMGAQVSVNLQTGAADNGKVLPPDFWSTVDYAHSLGLKVFIKSTIDVGFNADGSSNGADPKFNMYTPLPSGVTADQIFKNAAVYEQKLAVQAQAHGAEGFIVGSDNYGFDMGTNAQTYFKPIVDTVRAVYSGKVGYAANYNNGVFPMVDLIDYSINPYLGAGSSVAQIEAAWYSSGYAQKLKDMVSTYGGKTVIAHNFDEAQPGVGQMTLPNGATASTWYMFFNDPAKLNTLQANYSEQLMAYQAFVNVAKAASVAGAGFGEYDPWAVSAGPQYKQWTKLGGDLWDSPIEGAIAGTLAVL